ncbi:MAG: hypothetical protein P4L81_04195 [Candidatus Pacebacteria bacterium]|nr:hypothetical protein [Candidatus Paceibacterota bacterium]
MEPEKKSALARILEIATGIMAVTTVVILSSVAGMRAYIAYQPESLAAQAVAAELAQSTSTQTTYVCEGTSAAGCIASLSASGSQIVTISTDRGITTFSAATAAFPTTPGDIGFLTSLLQVGQAARSPAINAAASTSIGILDAIAPLPQTLPFVLHTSASIASSTIASTTVLLPATTSAPINYTQSTSSPNKFQASSSVSVKISTSTPVLSSSTPQNMPVPQTSTIVVSQSTTSGSYAPSQSPQSNFSPATTQPSLLQWLGSTLVTRGSTVLSNLRSLIKF